MPSESICDVVIPIWNQPALTRRCLESLSGSTPEAIRLILVDNGSGPETQNLLSGFKRESAIPVTLIRNESNLGFIQGTNQGIRAGLAPWVCLLNNDTILTTGWLTEMLKVAQSDPTIGLINPTSNSLGFHPGQLSLEAYAARFKAQSGQSTPLTTALGFCLLTRRALLDEVGLLDESFGMGYFDDDDLSRRMRERGYRCVRACAAYVFHSEKGSFQHLSGTDEAFQKNRRRFEQRWGRRLRILWDPERPDGEIALKLAGEGHWLYFVRGCDGLPPALHSHAQVNFLNLSDSSWRLRATARLLTKRKKPFDLVISNDATWSKWVKCLRWLHQANLLDRSAPDEILRQCQILSNCPS